MESITSLKEYFESHPIPVGLEIKPGETITDPDLFLESHFDILRTRKMESAEYILSLSRLLQVKSKIEVT